MPVGEKGGFKIKYLRIVIWQIYKEKENNNPPISIIKYHIKKIMSTIIKKNYTPLHPDPSGNIYWLQIYIANGYCKWIVDNSKS